MVRWQALSENDTVPWSTLVGRIAEQDRTDEVYSPEALAEELRATGVDPATDTWAVWDDDTLIAHGYLRVSSGRTSEGWVRAILNGGVDPRRRGEGIGTALLERMEGRALDLAGRRHPGATVQLRPQATRVDGDAAGLLERRGYARARFFIDMARPLPGGPLPAVDPRAVPLTAGLGERLRVAHNDAFSGHWGSTPQGTAGWSQFLTSQSLRPALSRLILDDEGSVLAYAVAEHWMDGAFYLGLIGTVPRARGARAGICSFMILLAFKSHLTSHRG